MGNLSIMSQYPAGLVPMVMPQGSPQGVQGVPAQYMMLPGGQMAAMQLPPGMQAHHPHAGLQPAAVLHHQQMAAAQQAAASHAAGAPVITQPGVTSAGAMAALGMGHPASIAGLPPHLAASVGTPVMSAMGGVPGMHQALQGGIPTPMAGLTQLSAAG